MEDYKTIGRRPIELDHKFTNSYHQFKHIYDVYINKGKERELYSEKIHIHFQGISKPIFDLYDNHFRNLYFYNQKKKAMQRTKQQEKLQLNSNTET